IRPELWLAALYGQRGFALLDARDAQTARRSFEIGLAIDRSNDDVNLGMARMCYDDGKYEKALGYLGIVIAASPRRPEARMLLGHTLAGMGRWRAARTELETWASLQPWSGQAQIEVAQADCRLGDYAGARAKLEFALAHSICDVDEVNARLKDLHGRAAAFLN
ncbi:MAG TPA: tetratricopeptide repeat protein, partial [Chthonomonadaceae bacterium]|nr:tetratricopeptide repeat protein [Chthonomonadaceae bacterium]